MKASSGRWKITGVFRSMTGRTRFFRTAWQQSHNVSLMGGTEGVRYNASASYFDQDGIVLNSNYKRFQTRMNTVVRRGKLNMSRLLPTMHVPFRPVVYLFIFIQRYE